MKYLDLTLPTPAENLACDEALLELCESTPGLEVLRVWEPVQPFVVLGHGNKAAVEASLPLCESRRVPVLRRTSGGGAVLQGRGCLNITLVLQIESRRELAGVTTTTAFVLERNRAVFESLLGVPVGCGGTSDLAAGGLKFAGHAQRRRRRCVLFHGACLLGLDLQLMDAVLRHPSREPAYRQGRGHAEFVRNTGLAGADVKAALREAWSARDELGGVPDELIARLVRDRYSRDDWNLKF